MKSKFSFIRISILVLSLRHRHTRRILLGVVIGLLCLDLSPAGNAFEGVFQESSPYRIEAQRWEEADKIFRSDSRWLGGDGATSVDLGHGRVLWLFGDSFIDLSGSGVRRTSDLVRNSIAIQKGYDPTTAEMQFSWKMKENVWIVGAVCIEALCRVLGAYDFYLKKKNPYIWDIADSTKRWKS